MFSILTILTALFSQFTFYVGVLGFFSSSIEAMLGVPQFYLNYQRKNTEGLAPLLILMWLWGDLFKLYYYATNDGPLELVLCSMFQSSIDVAILA
jgi:hypothetical protein